jgi:hypothetical protein
MTNFERILTEFAEETRDAARRELGSRTIGKNRTYGVATRALQKSLTFSVKGGSVTFGSPLPYAGFMHWGVNGTRKNRNAPYSFKYENPSRKHVDSIVQWMKDKPVRLQAVGGGFIKKKGPRGGDRVRSAAYLIARSIKKKGIKGVKYWTEAFEAMYPRYAQKLAEAKADDIVLELSAKVGNITIKAK